MSAHGDQATKKRIIYLDIFRFVMVSVALLSHVMGHFFIWDVLTPPFENYLRLFTRGASPGLLILFGFMLEFVYVKYASMNGLSYSARRMIYRAGLCYIAVALIATAGLIGLHTPIKHYLAQLLLLSNTVNGDIFALYFVMLLVMIPIVALRLRFGLLSLLGLIGGIWLIDFLILQRISIPLGDSLRPLNLAPLGDFLIGAGESGGPSVFHGLTVVLFGMILGNFFATRSRRGMYCLILLVGTAALIIAAEVTRVGWIGFIANVANYDAYRAHNALTYYAYGIVHAVAVIGIAWQLSRILPAAWQKFMTYLGSRTFIYFLFGNLVLTSSPRGSVLATFWASFVAFVLLVTLCYGLIRVWEAQGHSWPPIVALRERMLSVAAWVTQRLHLKPTLSIEAHMPEALTPKSRV